MSIKSRIRSTLGGLAVNSSELVDKQLVKNIILPFNKQPLLMSTSEQSGGLLRILAHNEQHGKRIIRHLENHKDELSIRSLHLADSPLEFKHKHNDPIQYTHSVIVRIFAREIFRSATSPNLLESEYHKTFINISKQERIVIDFSSPNIAKPFHLGHLKSTILGNYLANLNEYLGAQVTRLNYIGDWGTQYGLLSLGLEKYQNDMLVDQASFPLRQLVDVYVEANQRASVDENFRREAKRRFQALDHDIQSDINSHLFKQWKHIRDLSLDELKISYKNLGVNFDIFEYESDYAKCNEVVINRLDSKGAIRKLPDGAIVALVDKNKQTIEIPILKSDQTSLYLTRDIAAAMDRYRKYTFDKLLYVVGADQERHFHCLAELVSKLISVDKSHLVHVKMGKIKGMSTRSGQFVLLSDIICEASKQYAELTRETVTTKTQNEYEIEQVGQNLALSALLVYDMSQGRKQNYEFHWSKVMQRGRRSGLNLQATYARLCNLVKKARDIGLEPASENVINETAISHVEAMNLLSELDNFDIRLHRSYLLLDPQPLVNHALLLCSLINRARQTSDLSVINDSNEDSARSKLLLFERARGQLELIIKLIGLKPLERV